MDYRFFYDCCKSVLYLLSSKFKTQVNCGQRSNYVPNPNSEMIKKNRQDNIRALIESMYLQYIIL